MSLWCCCMLHNTAESANMIFYTSDWRRGQIYCVGIAVQHMFKASRWQVQSGAMKQLLYVMHILALEYLFSGFYGCWKFLWVSKVKKIQTWKKQASEATWCRSAAVLYRQNLLETARVYRARVDICWPCSIVLPEHHCWPLSEAEL